jgi:hypothetical protein
MGKNHKGGICRDEEVKKRMAEFRFLVIHDFIAPKKLTRGQKERLLREKTAIEWDIPYSGRSYISRSTLLNWLRRYERGGRRIEALYPDERTDKGRLRAIDEDTALSLINLNRELKASLRVIIKEAKTRAILPADFRGASRATLYRVFERPGVNKIEQAPLDRRRFEAECANEIWQSDCLHGPKVTEDAGVKYSP